MQLIGVQLDPVWENPPANFQKVDELLAGRLVPGGSLVVLPEMFNTGFTFDAATWAEPVGGATEAYLSGLASRLDVYVMAGKPTAYPGERPRNEALVYGRDGTLLARYAKIQTVTPLGETAHYEGGSEVVIVPIDEIQMAPFICYDLRFPENFRIAARQKPELYVVIASWPVTRIHHWVRLLQARAIENQAWVVGVNRTGSDPTYRHTGRSVIVDHHGEIVADAGESEGVVDAPFDLAALREYRAQLKFLDDLKS